MAAVLLSVHVVAAIVFVGAVTVAVSLFPRYARQAVADPPVAGARPVVHLLHRVSRVYAVLALAVPVFGIGVASALGVLDEAWVLVSMALTLAAGVLLAGVVLPRQRELGLAVDRAVDRAVEAGAEPGERTAAAIRQLAMASGVFNLLWAAVVVLMIVRPGSTTGV